VKLSDVASGLLAAAVGLAVALHARTFPPMPGQPVGPSLFPLVVGIGLAAAGAGLIVAGMRLPRGPLVAFDEWVRQPRMIGNVALVVTDLLFYALAVNSLGFLFTAVIFLAALFLGFGVRRTRILPAALAVTLAIHYVFYTLLRVPLPWGVLEGIAW
jgi:putative tricarboxylic transport membrane protein